MDADRNYRRALALAKQGRARNAKRVVPLLQAAADVGHPMASHALASWYIHGIGVPRDLGRAFELEKVAARKGVPEAIFNLARSYETGTGVRKNLRRAYLLYRRAAAHGDHGAVYEVGRCLYYGIGTKSRPALGIKWLLRTEEYRGAAGVRRSRARPRTYTGAE